MADARTLAHAEPRLAELAGTWSLDPAHTSLEMSVRHMMVATVRGRMEARTGTLEIDTENPERSRVEVEIDAGSIDTGHPDRDAHLRSADFLDAEKFPTVTFRSTSVEDEGNGEFRLKGELTVRDATRPVTLDAEFGGVVRDPYGNDRIGFSATGVLDRSEFGLTWNAPLETGGLVVGDKVKLAIDAEFFRPAS